MTEKQAYKILTNTPIRSQHNHIEYSKALHIALGALEKQVAKKVKYLNRHGEGYDLYNQDHFYCPCCGRRLRNKQKDNHCGRCGQALIFGGDDL